MKKKLLTLVFIIPLTLLAQESKLGNWMILFGNKNFKSNWNWHHEVQYRNYNAAGDLEQLLLRTGVGFNLAENNNNLLLGYGFIHSQNYSDTLVEKLRLNEHRIYQQFITKQNIGRVGLQHRYRFEQRFFEDNSFKMRLRYFLAFNIPLNQPTMDKNTWYLSAYNELFVNTANTIFDRNRVYGGIGYKLNKLARFEIGYMNQFFNKGQRDQINLIVFLNW